MAPPCFAALAKSLHVSHVLYALSEELAERRLSCHNSMITPCLSPVLSFSLPLPPHQSNKPSGVIPLLQLYRIFDGKTAGVPLSYCVGLEGAGGCYLHYLKAESADIYNSWLRVRQSDFCLRALSLWHCACHVNPSYSHSCVAKGLCLCISCTGTNCIEGAWYYSRCTVRCPD